MKSMIAVSITKRGVLSVTKLPQKSKFNKEFFVNFVLEDIKTQLEIKNIKPTKTKPFIHMDNSTCHSGKIYLDGQGFKRVDHPPHSPDLAPCDFYLFGHLKSLLEGKVFTNDNDLYCEVKAILNSIPSIVF